MPANGCTYSIKINDIDNKINELLKHFGIENNQELYRQMLTTIYKLNEDRCDSGDLKIINSALKEMRYASKVFAPYRANRIITIFGSARIRKTDPIYAAAKELAEIMVKQDWMIITGSGQGIMEAGHEGAGSEKSFGVNISLPFEQEPNIIIKDDPKQINFKYFFSRKLTFIKESDAIALFPGGFGTHDEAYETLTLLQTGKTEPRPIVFVDHPGGDYWKKWLSFVEDNLLKRGYICDTDMHLLHITDNIDEAVNILTSFYRVYNSSRYVGDRLVIRLNKHISTDYLNYINSKYRHIYNGGGITVSGTLPEEEDEPAIRHLPRLILKFNKKSFGELHRLIDDINKA